MASKIRKIFDSAKLFVHGLLLSVMHTDLHDQKVQTIVNKGLEIANMLHSGNIPPDIEATAVTFLHGLLQGLDIEDLTDEEIKKIVDKAIALALSFHATVPAPPADEPIHTVMPMPAPAAAAAPVAAENKTEQPAEDPWDKFYADQAAGRT